MFYHKRWLEIAGRINARDVKKKQTTFGILFFHYKYDSCDDRSLISIKCCSMSLITKAYYDINKLM